VRLVLGESARVTLLGCAIGVAGALALARGVAHLLYNVAPYDPVVMVGASVALAFAALSAAFVPARRASGVNPVTALRE
jgi:ABC-type antimicrobial peptide transport system permease subunit